jgi:DNA end-binding protein Ku
VRRNRIVDGRDIGENRARCHSANRFPRKGKSGRGPLDGRRTHPALFVFANEVRDVGQVPKAEGEKVPKCEIELAENLIDKLSEEAFEPEKYHDEYRERFLAMVDQKAKGQEITVAARAPERRGKVLDLMAALKQSLEGIGPSQGRPVGQTGRTAAKAARKRRKA